MRFGFGSVPSGRSSLAPTLVVVVVVAVGVFMDISMDIGEFIFIFLYLFLIHFFLFLPSVSTAAVQPSAAAAYSNLMCHFKKANDLPKRVNRTGILACDGQRLALGVAKRS